MLYLLTGEQSDRLDYKLVDRSFFEDWIEFFNHPDTARFIGMQDTGTPPDRCREWFRRVEERYQNDHGGMNALIDRNTGTFVGQCGLLVQDVDGQKESEIGYSIAMNTRLNNDLIRKYCRVKMNCLFS